jgi:hypothetical protein
MDKVQDCFSCTHYDLVVIGAGPHALALVTRLLERWPSSVISETEHSRLHHIHSGKSHRGTDSVTPLVLNGLNKRILVIDKYGEWMAKWDKSFRAYDIEYLRSPLFFHIDPAHPEALRAYAQKYNRSSELHDITYIVDNCKNSRRNGKRGRDFNQVDREQFYTPGTRLFSDFCTDLIDRYNLYDMVVQGVCTKVDKTPQGFEVTYSCREDGCLNTTKIHANAVVCAIGNTNIKRIPGFVNDIKPNYPSSRICHANDFVDCLFSDDTDHCSHNDHDAEIIPKTLSAKLLNHEKTSLVVVGGGLTAAQMVDVAVKRGFTDVKLVMRSSMKVRQFDFSLDLMGRNAGRWLANFWMERNLKCRLKMIAQERNGGSITPEYLQMLEKYVESGILKICTNVQVQNCEWISSSNTNDGIWEYQLSDKKSKYQCDQIWLATGSIFDIFKEPVLEVLAEKYDLNSVNGIPVLDDNLRLHQDLDFFIMGGYASLILGPAAGNLQGGRVGAERIASKLLEIWTDGKYTEIGTKVGHRSAWTMADVAANVGNYFSALSIND